MRRQRKKLAQVARIQARGQLHIQTRDAHHEEPQAAVDESLATWGLQRAAHDAGAPPPAALDKCYLWPCNVVIFNVWQRVQTQWRVGVEGRTGLEYSAVAAYLRDVLALKPPARAEMFAGLQAMEFAALDEWAQQRD